MKIVIFKQRVNEASNEEFDVNTRQILFLQTGRFTEH